MEGTVNMIISKRELEILYALFNRHLDPSSSIPMPKDATLHEMNVLAEKLRQIDKIG